MLAEFHTIGATIATIVVAAAFGELPLVLMMLSHGRTNP